VATDGITVLIINHNTEAELRGCLKSLPNCPVTVFDNHSSDGSAAMVRAEFPQAQLIVSEVNLGYGAAANRAVQACSSEYFVVSNSDVIFPPGSLQAMAEYLDRNPRVGLMGPRLLNGDGTLQASCFPLPGGLRWLLDNDGVAGNLKWAPGAGKLFLRAWDHDGERNVPWVKGAVLAIRGSAFRDVSGFDESFFMYYEETDLCLRMARRGWRIRFAPVTGVVHLGGVSTAKMRAAMALALFTSSMHFAANHYSRVHYALLSRFWKAILCVRWLRDRTSLARCSNPVERNIIAEDLQVWKTGLRWKLPKSSAS
jgi:GT2 family glycosyltransferase